MSSQYDPSARPVIVGEVLFDHYPDGQKILAGAPLAVAWHLQGFGLRPLLVTRIGQDTDGELALMAMQQWGLDTRAVQIDPEHPTGQVTISKQKLENNFEIPVQQAWDFISSYAAVDWIKTLPCSLLYAGTLAQRHHVSSESLQTLIQQTGLPLFLDINIRKPWIDKKTVQQSLNQASWLKINNNELEDIIATSQPAIQKAKQLKIVHGIEMVFLTCGKHGSVIIGDQTITESKQKRDIRIKDTVGAGDAYVAVCILGIHKSWNQSCIARRANQFAALICQHQGATGLQQENYTQLLNDWDQN